MWEGDTRGAETLRIEAVRLRHQVTEYLLRTLGAVFLKRGCGCGNAVQWTTSTHNNTRQTLGLDGHWHVIRMADSLASIKLLEVIC